MIQQPYTGSFCAITVYTTFIATPQKLEQKLLKFGNFWLILETSKALNFLVFEIFCSSFLRCRN